MHCRKAALTAVFIAFQSVGVTLMGQTIDLGRKLEAAAIPFVSMSISKEGEVLGPVNMFSSYMLLDTGAPGVLLFGRVADELNATSADFRVGVALGFGVNGLPVDYFVSEPVSVVIDDLFSVENVAIMSDPIQRLGGFPPIGGIVGMPAMVERVTSLDYSPDPFEGSIIERLYNLVDVEFSGKLPVAQGHRYGVEATPFIYSTTGLEVPPTIGPVPILDASHRVGCETSTGTYLFDTGAQVSFMGMDRLAEMGLTLDDAVDFIEISGADGTFEQPLFSLDELRLPTEDGIDLVWRRSDGAPFLVNGLNLSDNFPFDGVLGADFFATDAIEEIHLDFRDWTNGTETGLGTIYFDIDPNLDRADVGRILSADANADGSVDRLDRDIWEANNGQTQTRCGTGDFNRDGRTDEADLIIWNQQRQTSCDLDGDGSCQAADLELLLDAVGTIRDEFDLDASGGVIDLADRDAWLVAAGTRNRGSRYLVGDLNFDGAVDSQDLNALGRNWNSTDGPSYTDGDVDGDQYVGANDLNALGLNWQRANAALPVPELSCTWWLLVGFGWFCRFRPTTAER